MNRFSIGGSSCPLQFQFLLFFIFMFNVPLPILFLTALCVVTHTLLLLRNRVLKSSDLCVILVAFMSFCDWIVRVGNAAPDSSSSSHQQPGIILLISFGSGVLSSLVLMQPRIFFLLSSFSRINPSPFTRSVFGCSVVNGGLFTL